MGKNLPSAEQSGSRRARDQEASRAADAWRVSVRLHTYTRDSAKQNRRIGRPRTGAQATWYNNQPVRDLMPSVTHCQPGQTQISGKVAELLTNAKETHTKNDQLAAARRQKLVKGIVQKCAAGNPFLRCSLLIELGSRVVDTKNPVPG